MNKLFERIESLKKEIDLLFPGREWSKQYLEKVKLDFTYQNNKIENNKLSYGQTLLFLKEATTPKDVSVKDCLDTKNHYEIVDVIFKSYKNELSEKMILNLHSKLMKDLVQWKYKDDYSPGKYKWDTNYTIKQDGTMHWYMDHRKAPGAIRELVKETNERLKTSNQKSVQKHPLTIAAYFHTRFLEIHPFADGNGRISRIFTNDILIKKGYSPVFIKDSNKSVYLGLFEKSNSKKLTPMINFLGKQLEESLIAKKQMILESLKMQKEKSKLHKRRFAL